MRSRISKYFPVPKRPCVIMRSYVMNQAVPQVLNVGGSRIQLFNWQSSKKSRPFRVLSVDETRNGKPHCILMCFDDSLQCDRNHRGYGSEDSQALPSWFIQIFSNHYRLMPKLWALLAYQAIRLGQPTLRFLSCDAIAPSGSRGKPTQTV